MGVDADGGHAHARGHHRDFDAFVGASVALDAPDVVHQPGIFEEVLGDELGAEGIAGHEDGFAEVAGDSVDVGVG